MYNEIGSQRVVGGVLCGTLLEYMYIGVVIEQEISLQVAIRRKDQVQCGVDLVVLGEMY